MSLNKLSLAGNNRLGTRKSLTFFYCVFSHDLSFFSNPPPIVSPCLMGLAERSRRRREPRPMKTLSGRMVSLLLARDSVISFRVAASIVESMCWMWFPDRIAIILAFFHKVPTLKVVANEKWGGSVSWLVFEDGFRTVAIGGLTIASLPTLLLFHYSLPLILNLHE